MAVKSINATQNPLALVIKKIPLWSIYTFGLMPAVWYFYLGITDQLGADPMKVLERTLGLWALRFLIVTLTISPLRQLAGINLIRFRRQFGLLAFYYASMHLLTYLVLDQGLDIGLIVADIIKRWYITIGMAAFTLLVPLAITSNNISIRLLGGDVWVRLHQLVYFVIILAALHFVMVVKSWPPQPLYYAAIVILLLVYRLVRNLWRQQRSRLVAE